MEETATERLLISQIENPILPTEKSWIPAGHTITVMEHSWLKARGVTEAFLEARLDPERPLGPMIMEDEVSGVIARSNTCHKGLEDYHWMMVQQSASEEQGLGDSTEE